MGMSRAAATTPPSHFASGRGIAPAFGALDGSDR
jgi:hypothetical protein